MFLVLEMMKSYLKKKEKIMVVNVGNTYSQMLGLLRKQGVNIELSINTGHLVMVEVNEASQGWFRAEVPMTEQRP